MDIRKTRDTRKERNHQVYMDRYIEKYIDISKIDTSKINNDEYYEEIKKRFNILCDVEKSITEKRVELLNAMNDCCYKRYCHEQDR